MRIALAALFAIALIWLVKPQSGTNLNKSIELTATRTSQAPIQTVPLQTTKTVTSPAPQPVAETVQANAPAPAPVAPPQPTNTYASGCSSYTSIFQQYAWNVSIAMAICEAESGGNPYAVSSTNDYGLMQLHDEEIYNPSANIAGAYQKYLSQGWEAWTTYNTGAYQKYL